MESCIQYSEYSIQQTQVGKQPTTDLPMILKAFCLGGEKSDLQHVCQTKEIND